MKRQALISAIVAMLFSAGASAAGSSAAAQIAGAGSPNGRLAGSPEAIDAATLARAQQKLAHAVQIANQFSASAASAGLAERWRSEMINALMRAPESSFMQVQGKANVQDAMSAALALNSPNASASGATPKVLGDVGDDLTYIPLSAPCRIVDTRSGGGSLVAGTPRTFNFTDTNASQGGSGCNPFAGYIGGGVPGAAAINITVIGGPVATAGSFLQAYPAGGSTTTSWLNFGAGQIIANEGILGISYPQAQFTLVSNAAVDAIVDVFGSFVRPAATPLNCVVVGPTTGTTAIGTISIPASSTNFYGTGTCPAGYTVTTPYCFNNNIAGVYSGGSGVYNGQAGTGNAAFCSFTNTTGAAQTVYIGTTCCRIPGR